MLKLTHHERVLRFGQLVPPTTTSEEGRNLAERNYSYLLSCSVASPRDYYRKFPHSLDFRVPEGSTFFGKLVFNLQHHHTSTPGQAGRVCRRGHSRDTMEHFSLSANDVIRSNRKTMLCRNNSMLFFCPSPFMATFSPGWTDGRKCRGRRAEWEDEATSKTN